MLIFLICLQILHGKFSGAVTAAAKNQCWESLTKDVLAVSGIARTADELKRKWICVKSEAKKSAAAGIKSMNQTGGGPGVEDMSAMQQRVIQVIGQVCVEGIVGGIDTAACLKNDDLTGIGEVHYMY